MLIVWLNAWSKDGLIAKSVWERPLYAATGDWMDKAASLLPGGGSNQTILVCSTVQVFLAFWLEQVARTEYLHVDVDYAFLKNIVVRNNFFHFVVKAYFIGIWVQDVIRHQLFGSLNFEQQRNSVAFSSISPENKRRNESGSRA